MVAGSAETVGGSGLRKEFIDSAIKGFAQMAYKLKPLCQVDSSSAWTESYYRETSTELTGGTGSNVRGVPRLAPLPYGEVTWTKVSSLIQKYGMEGVISYEDEFYNNIPALTRTLLRIGNAVAYSVDAVIEAAILANAGNSVAIATGYEWDSATIANRDPVKDILYGIKECSVDNIDVLQNGYLVLSPTDYANLMMNSKVINNPSFKTADVVSNGVVGQICGLTIVVSNAVQASGAYIVKGKEALVWKEAMPLRTEVINDPFIKKTVRACEFGVCQVPLPNGICKITNTQKQ